MSASRTTPKRREMSEKSAQDMSGVDAEQLLGTRAAVVLVEKLKEFRQSYNRTHGQVCEFFEQAHIIEKVYQHSPGPSKTAERRERKVDEGENEDDCCNEQKTWSIKQKLNSWRAVMREVVCDVCPNLQLENQPDINPGLMKHVLDEIRKLKTELAFQHNTILELTHQLENRQSTNKKKDRLIEKLMQENREMGRECHLAGNNNQRRTVSAPQGAGDHIHLHSVASFDQGDFVQFGSIESLSDLPFDLEEMQSRKHLEHGHVGSNTIKGETSIHQVSTSKLPLQEVRSHSLPFDLSISLGSPHEDSKESVDRNINDDSSRSEVPSALRRIPPGERWKSGRAIMGICGRVCLAALVCKAMRKATGK